MKAMTFNTQHCLNYIERKIDFQVMADAIKQCDADIVGLNEMYEWGETAEYEKQTAVLAELTGLKYSYFAKAFLVFEKHAYGNGFISKHPIVSTETILVPDAERIPGHKHYETRCLLKVKLEGGITVIVTHFGLNEEEQLKSVETILQHIEPEKCILMGDFNVMPEDEILNPIRSKMKDVAECFTEPKFSYPSDKPNRKIDYIFVSKDIDVVSADIPAIVASDHRPHTAEINL